MVEDHLHLPLHPEKTRILDAHTTVFDFLGFTFFWTAPGDTGRPLFGSKGAAIERLKARIRDPTRRKRPLNLEMVIAGPVPAIRGWGQYFTIIHREDYSRWDAWIRERCCSIVVRRPRSRRGQPGDASGIRGAPGLRGLGKPEEMRLQFDPYELAAQRALKASFDPKALLNPGKVLPRECASP